MTARAEDVAIERGLGETLHQARVTGELPVMVLPKSGFAKKYALFGTNYGSLDSEFTSSLVGRRSRVPAGIAHFLEHKMFEKEDGDVMDRFSSMGCSANAMTSFNHTGYLIECTERFDECLELLVDFVTRPHFTADLVEKEKGIIVQEINSYLDDPGWRGFMGLLSNLYKNHPLAVDIAGTEESIAKTKVDDLYLCHSTFYTPANMHLAVAGDVDPGRVFKIVDEVVARNRGDGNATFKRHHRPHPRRVGRRRSREQMPVVSRKLNLGWLVNFDDVAVDSYTMEIALEIFFGALFSKSGALHQELYRDGLVDDSFHSSVYAENEFAFVHVGADTPSPSRLEKTLVNAVLRAREDGLPSDQTRRSRRRIYGGFVSSFNSVGSICWNLVDCRSKKHSLMEYGKSVMKMRDAEMMSIVREAIQPEGWASHEIVPVD